MSAGRSYLDPAILARISALQLRAKTVAEGLLSGLHRSRFRGYSLEFAQHREYSSGDELKYIDWKVYGRTDRFFVKEFEQETTLRVFVLLDSTGSMSFKGESSPLSKYDYGATVSASLAYLTLRQGDSAGLGILRGSNVKLVPARSSHAHLNILLEELAGAMPQGETSLSGNIESVAHLIKKRACFIIISDLFDDPERFLKSVKFLRFKKNEVIVLHLLDRMERDFPYSGMIRFDSLENQGNISLEGGDYRREYHSAISRFIDETRATLRDCGVAYHCAATDEPVDRVLRVLLSPAISH